MILHTGSFVSKTDINDIGSKSKGSKSNDVICCYCISLHCDDLPICVMKYKAEMRFLES